MSRRIRGLLLAVVAVLAADGRLQAQAPAPASADVDVATAPVEIDGHVLFRLRGVSSFPAAERARLVTDRIVAAAADPAASVDGLRVVESDVAAEIALGDEPLLRILDADAALEQVRRGELARAHMVRVRQAIVDYRAARTRDARVRNGITTLVATLVLALGIGLIVWLWRRLDVLMIARMERHVQTVGIQSFEVVRADQIRAALRNGVLGLRTVVILVGILVYLGYLLAVWPATRGLSRDIVGFALSPLDVIGSGIVAERPQPRLPGGALLRHSAGAQARPPVLRDGRPRHGEARQLRRGLGGADLQDRPDRHRRVRADRRLSLHPGVRVGRVQGRLALHRHRLLAGILVRDLEHHRRLHDDLPPRLQGRRPREDRRRHGRRDRDAAAGHAPQDVQERGDRHPELADPGG